VTLASDQPQFYLISGETEPAIGPRACYLKRWLSTPEGYAIYLLVRIDPHLHWDTSIGMIDTDELILQNRHPGQLYPVAHWPGWVNVAQIINNDIKHTGVARLEDLRHILIGELWPTAQEAKKSLRLLIGTHDHDPWI
jgi:hypothetical protein